TSRCPIRVTRLVRRLASATVSGMRPGSSGGASSGWVGGGAVVLVSMRIAAAVTAQAARAIMVRTRWRSSAGPLWIATGGDQAGDLADFGAVTQVPVVVERWDPGLRSADRLPDGFGDRHPDAEAGVDPSLAQGTDVGQEPLGAAGRVRPDRDQVLS